MPIELVTKVHVQKNENEETWYGTYLFKGLRKGDVEDFCEEVAKASGADVGNIKGTWDFETKEWVHLLITLKGFTTATEAEKTIQLLKETAKKYKIKSRHETTLDEQT